MKCRLAPDRSLTPTLSRRARERTRYANFIVRAIASRPTGTQPFPISVPPRLNFANVNNIRARPVFCTAGQNRGRSCTRRRRAGSGQACQKPSGIPRPRPFWSRNSGSRFARPVLYQRPEVEPDAVTRFCEAVVSLGQDLIFHRHPAPRGNAFWRIRRHV